MRVSIIANGSSEHIYRLVNYLALNDVEVHLISRHYPDYISESVVMHSLNVCPLLWPLQIKQLMNKIKPDIVDGHFASVYGFLAALTGFHPLVVTVWGSDLLIQPWKNWLWKYTTRYAFNCADAINCLFPLDMAENELTKLGINTDKVRTTLLGVDTRQFKPVKYDDRLASEFGISTKKRLVINPRGFAPVYDCETFFNAIPLVISEISGVQFLVLHKKGQRKTGETIVKRLGISKNVILKEWVAQSMMPQLLSLADIYVSSSLSDGASNALLEAMACELAPVVTDIPANRPWVQDGENGYLFPKGDYHTLAKKIILLLQDEEKRKKFGQKSREIVCEKAEQSTQMARIEEIYQELGLINTGNKK